MRLPDQLLILQKGFPDLFLESRIDAFVRDEERALDEHAVGCKEIQLFVITQLRKPLLQIQFAVCPAPVQRKSDDPSNYAE